MAESLDQFLINVRIADGLDVALAALLIYLIFRILRRRADRAVVVVVFIVAVVYLLARLLQMYLTLALFQAGLTVILFVLAIIFQQDIRHASERLSSWRPFARRDPTQSLDQFFTILSEAVSLLAEEKTGALIVLKGRQPLERHTRGGIKANADLSIPLLHGIFNPKTRGHDGAVIIDRERVSRFAVHLPLSTNLSEVGLGGTRHAAALGLAERNDSLIIVVSEERGTISLAEEGRLELLEKPSVLQDRLEAFCGRYASHPSQQRGRSLLSQLGMIAGSILLAAGLWFTFAFRVDTVTRSVAAVPIQFREIPNDWRIEEVDPPTVDLTLLGSERALNDLNAESLKASVQFKELEEGPNDIAIDETHLSLPAEISLRAVTPDTIRVWMHEYGAARLPVQVKTRGELPKGLELVEIKSNPPTVPVIIRKDVVRPEFIETVPIDLSKLTRQSGAIEAKLSLPLGVSKAANAPPVKVSFDLRPKE